MSTTDVNARTETASMQNACDLKLEVVVIPVSDVDRSKAFYEHLGWRPDADFSFDNGFRVVQFTPPGSSTSIQFGTKITNAEPGSAQGMHLVVSDIAAARSQLAGCGADVTDVFHPGAPGAEFEPAPRNDRVDGMAENHASYESFCCLCDPDGNSWILQEVTTRFPGRCSPDVTGYASIPDLANAMRRASVAHGEHEARTGKADPDWPDWYAAFMVAEQAGTPLPE
jgi:catechol 2,3-dioxygenase-like lactoylglutathione lyase family enzyme